MIIGMLKRKMLAILMLASLCGMVIVPPAFSQQTLEDADRIIDQVLQLYRQGKYAEAIPLAKQALEICERLLDPDHDSIVISLINLAVLYDNMGQYEKSAPLYIRLVNIIIKKTPHENPVGYVKVLNNFAESRKGIGEYDEAESLLIRAKEIIEEELGQNYPAYADILNNLAEAYVHMRLYEKAEPLLVQAKNIKKIELGESHPDYATTVNNLAETYYIMGQYEKAEPLLIQAMEIRRNSLGENHPAYASSLTNLAALYAATNRPDKARATLTQSMQIKQKNIRHVFDFVSEPAMQAYLAIDNNSLGTLISLFAGQQETSPDAAQTTLEWVLRRKAIILDSLIQFRQAEYLLEHDAKFATTKARYQYLGQQVSNISLNKPEAMADAELQQQIRKLQKERADLQAELNGMLSALRPNQSTRDIDFANLRQKLALNISLVEFVYTEMVDFKDTGLRATWKPAHYFAFVLTGGNTPPQMIDLGEAKAIDEAIRATRTSIIEFGEKWQTDKSGVLNEADDEKQYQKTAKHLFDLVFAPVKKHLGASKTIYLAADGQLNLIPFEALVDQDGKYLAESFQFAYLSSGRDLIRTHSGTARGTTVFAAPDFNLGAAQREVETKRLIERLPNKSIMTSRGMRSGEIRGSNWKPLDGTLREAADIEQELTNSKFGPVKKYTGKEALEEVFKALRSPKVLHVASHGFFLPDEKPKPDESRAPVDEGTGFGQARGFARLQGTENPLLRSGIVLAGANTVGQQSEQKFSGDDGWVTAEEVAMMDLRGTELVVLSTCDSGLGDAQIGEGVYGLRRAFLYAGTKTLVMSLYAVPDEQTRDMMKWFYASLKAGKGKLESLHEAQMKMIGARRKQGGAAHPFFWASFVLAGDAN